MIIARKAFYLKKVAKGFVNLNGDRVTNVFRSEDNKNILILNMWIELGSEYDFTTVTASAHLNLNTLNTRITISGAGSRKYNHIIKRTVQSIVDGLTDNSNKEYASDCADAHHMTVHYYYDKLKLQGADNAVINEFNANSYKKSVKEIDKLYKRLVKQYKLIEIIVHEFYKDKNKAIEMSYLDDEISYHVNVYGHKPKQVFIVPFWDHKRFKDDKNKLVLMPT